MFSLILVQRPSARTCKQVFKPLIWQNGSMFQQLCFHWVRYKVWSTLKRHASLWISANLQLKPPSLHVRNCISFVLKWVDHLIKRFVQHIVSCLIAFHFNICKRLPEVKSLLCGTFSPSVTLSALLPHLKPVETQTKSCSGTRVSMKGNLLTSHFFLSLWTKNGWKTLANKAEAHYKQNLCFYFQNRTFSGLECRSFRWACGICTWPQINFLAENLTFLRSSL